MSSLSMQFGREKDLGDNNSWRIELSWKNYRLQTNGEETEAK